MSMSPRRASRVVIPFLALSACAADPRMSESPDIVGSEHDEGARAARAPTAQQRAQWQAWLDARTPRQHVNGQISDSEGAVWDCVAIGHQSAFRRGTLERARRAAEVVDQAVADGITVSDAEVQAQVAATSARGGFKDVDDSAVVATELDAALAEIEAEAQKQVRNADDAGDQRGTPDIQGRCTPGFVPVRAWTVDDIARAGDLEKFVNPAPPAGDSILNHEYATTRDWGTFVGAKGYLNIWDPCVIA